MKTDIHQKAGRETPSRVGSHELFDRISARYDLLNHLLSLGRDRYWRQRVSRIARQGPHQTVMDVACGTCDLIISTFAHNRDIQRGIGIDMADRMLAIGKEKISRVDPEGRLNLIRGDGCGLPVASGSIDFAMIAFGIRNMVDPARCLSELHRALKPGGRLAVLEFSLPGNAAVRVAYLAYFRYILPFVGGIISGDRSAYRYLNQTVETFAYGSAFGDMMGEAGFARVRIEPLTFGIATIYCGERQ